ncbi:MULTISPECIES: anti-sigma factor family protein [unclassified Paenibacillus]|uniref:anti-sigma factor family protein n=1 Tax=unclassified Paenibacillus TaxID=185978 RepID=UPI0030F5F4E1
MKCAEVMEWMHRYLDHDLSQDEMIEMFRHIDDCSSCAEVFDRLKMLSQQLEQLPDVKPPFSLVDSILPQLDQLDLNIQGKSADAVSPEEDPKVVPFSRKSTHGKASKGASLAARTGIGAAAAAVILLIAMFNMPGSMPTADVEQSLQQTAENNAGNDALSIMSSAATDSAEEDAAPGESKQELENSEKVDPTSAGGGQNTGGSAAPAETAAAPTAEATDKAPAMTKKSGSDKRTSSRKVTNGTATPAPGAADMDSKSSNNMELDEGGDPAAADSREFLDASHEPGAGEDRNMGFSALKAQASWTSPDGLYTAELAEQQLVIYKLPSNGPEQERTVLTSLPLEGAWVSGNWSADGLQFSYVTEQNGAEVANVYTVPEAGVSASPAASPEPTPVASPAVTPDAATSNK